MSTETRKFYSDLKESYLFFHSILFKAHLCGVVYCALVIFCDYSKLSNNELCELIYFSLKGIFISFAISLSLSIIASIAIALISSKSNNIQDKFINTKNNSNIQNH